jgi:hypothetical protein
VLSNRLCLTQVSWKKVGKRWICFLLWWSIGNIYQWGLCHELHWYITTWHYVLQHDTNAEFYSVRVFMWSWSCNVLFSKICVVVKMTMIYRKL